MSKIFVRERRHIGRGAGRPRFAIVAVEGLDLKVYQTHIRKSELNKLAESVAAEIVFLTRGEQAGEESEGAEGGKGRRRHGGRRGDKRSHDQE
jgi:hypothetical protein